MKFQKNKFLSLPKKRQQKKCAEILRKIYEQPEHSELLQHYQEIQCWLGGAPLDSTTSEDISNRYHIHLKAAEYHLGESDLLPRVKRGDNRDMKGEVLPVSIYLDQIRSAHNVGSILRTTEAFGLGKIFFSRDVPGVDHPQVQKTSMGTWEHVSCRHCCDLLELPRPLIALETSPDAVALEDFIFPKVFTLALGNEEYGCSEDVLRQADYVIKIPLRGRKNSLNVANAFAITAAEIVRQQ